MTISSRMLIVVDDGRLLTKVLMAQLTIAGQKSFILRLPIRLHLFLERFAPDDFADDMRRQPRQRLFPGEPQGCAPGRRSPPQTRSAWPGRS